MKPLAKGELENMQAGTVAIRLASLQSEYDAIRDRKEIPPDWIINDIFRCKMRMEAEGIKQVEPVKKKEDVPDWLKKVSENRRKPRPF